MSTASSKILSSHKVRISDAPVRVGNLHGAAGLPNPGQSPADSKHDHDPEVILEHDADGNVAAIRIRCRCGEELTIACDYSNAA